MIELIILIIYLGIGLYAMIEMLIMARTWRNKWKVFDKEIIDIVNRRLEDFILEAELYKKL